MEEYRNTVDRQTLEFKDLPLEDLDQPNPEQTLNEDDQQEEQQENEQQQNQEVQERRQSQQNQKWPKYILAKFGLNQSSFFSKVMVYKIEYEIEEGQKEYIYRRFNDLEAFRKHLRKSFPCVYIIPLMQRSFLDGLNESQVAEKIQNINDFFSFILERQELFDVQSFWTLLNKKYKEGQIEGALKHVDKIPQEEIIEKYQSVFSNEIGEDQYLKDEQIDQIRETLEKIQTNKQYFEGLEKICQQSQKSNSEKKIQKLKNYLDKIIIPFAEDSKNFKILKKQIQGISDYNIQQFLIGFGKKVNHLSQEFDQFADLFDEFADVKEQLDDIYQHQNEDVQLLEELQKQNKQTDSKQIKALEKLTESRKENIQKLEKLNSELQILKKRKNKIYFQALNTLAEQKKSYYREKVKFWSKIIEISEQRVNKHNQ